jgi:hypothetical protein
VTTNARPDQDGVEPELDLVTTFDVRRVDSDADQVVGQILGLLSAGTTLVDLSHHDRFGTVIELRAKQTGQADQ